MKKKYGVYLNRIKNIFVIYVKSDDDHWERAFSNVFEDIPKSPGNGLVLRQVHYDIYNRDYGEQHGRLDWVSSQDLMDQFAKDKIMPEIFRLDTGMVDLTCALELYTLVCRELTRIS